MGIESCEACGFVALAFWYGMLEVFMGVSFGHRM